MMLLFNELFYGEYLIKQFQFFSYSINLKNNNYENYTYKIQHNIEHNEYCQRSQL
jgi:hypothetical protein